MQQKCMYFNISEKKLLGFFKEVSEDNHLNIGIFIFTYNNRI